MNQKGFAPVFIILSLVVVVGLIGGAYYLGTLTNKETVNTVKENEILPSIKPSQTTVPTETKTDEEWIDFVSTIEGSNLDVTFKYPKGWETSEFGEGNQAGGTYIISMQNHKIGECDSYDDCQTIDFQLSSPADGVSEEYQDISKIAIGEKLVKDQTEQGSKIYLRRPDTMVDGTNSYQYLVERTGKYLPKMSYNVLTKRGPKYYYSSSSNESLLQKFITTIKFSE